jgi:hypothetical protein
MEQFKALKHDGYLYAVSLETHWDGGGTPKKSSPPEWGSDETSIEQG